MVRARVRPRTRERRVLVVRDGAAGCGGVLAACSGEGWRASISVHNALRPRQRRPARGLTLTKRQMWRAGDGGARIQCAA
jgi:hypothetical protein